MAKKDFMALMKEKTVEMRPSVLSAEENIKRQIVVLDQLRDLIQPLTAEEFELLEQNILKYGVKDPLTIWETTDIIAGLGNLNVDVYVLVDGHNRNQIIQKHSLDFRINIMQFASLDDVKEYMIDYQLGRRNLTSEQASYLRGMRYNQQKARRGSNLRTTEPQVNMAEALATEYGVSSRTIKRDGEFAASLEKLPPEAKRDVLAGKLPKSVVSKGAQIGEEVSSIAGNIPASDVDSDPAGGTVTDNIAQLEVQIRKLANGALNQKTGAKLIKKTNDLLRLLASK